MIALTAATALLATAAAASSVGSAVVVNKCSYDVYVCNTPAADGGYSEIDQTLSSGGTYEQQWTELSNSQGWSIKLSKSSSLGNIMQYEYTFHNDGIIWYDLSDVNGNPWDGNWEITATNAANDCDPKDQAYRYSTDDAYGMQACSSDSTITVTLCSGESSDNSTSGSGSSSAQAPSSTASSIASSAASSYTVPSSSAQSWSSGWGHGYNAVGTGASSTSAPPASTTLLTSASSTTSSQVTTAPDGVTVTEVATDVVTQVITATAYAKRDEPHRHHHRHNHA
jgi:hypothetical protein